MNAHLDWMDINDRHLAATVEWILLRLENLAQANTDTGQAGSHTSQRNCDHEAIELAQQKILTLEDHDTAPALILLGKALGLSVFDKQVLALCTAMELNTKTASLCAQAQNDPNKPYPTFALAFVLFDDPDWKALSPDAPLRYWRLLEIHQPGPQALTAAALSADERIVNYLKGLNYLDDRLTPLLDPIYPEPTRITHINESIDETLPASQQLAVNRVIECIQSTNGLQQQAPVIELLGHDSASKHLIAERVASVFGLSLYGIDIKSLPAQPGDFETFTRLWHRESLLMPLALYIEMDGISEGEKTPLKRFLKRSNGIVFLDLEDARTETVRHRFAIEINKPTPEEQQGLWREALQDRAQDQPQRLAEQFSFSQSDISRLAINAIDTYCKASPSHNDAALSSTVNPKLGNELWQSCRIAARSGMEQLAHRIDAKADWNQLVLPEEQTALLHQITDQVSQRNRVYEDWGFREQMNRGLGINALFAGESGTGKTMAAEVIANALELDLYRIDLSSVVSKYIGETEKNLRKLFDTAEDSGAILFFDEADALFGKRSEVKDSHDRYANIEINYLLQRMESYRGLAILATNLKGSLDKAFMRRLRFIVDFPLPEIEQRKEIWQKVFPLDTPIDKKVDYDRLARLNLSGGSILNIALNAAFLAAQERVSITMRLLLSAAQAEFKKMERPAKKSDFRWLETTETK